MDEKKVFYLFISEKMIELIVEYSNEEIDTKAAQLNFKQSFIGRTDHIEISALLGLLLVAGVLKSGGLSADEQK